MFRYISAAFWARPNLPMLGAIPTNLVALACFGILGALINPGIWLIGVGLELGYLFALATNKRFQKVVDAGDHAAVESDRQRSWNELLANCDLASRDRFASVWDKITRVGNLQQAASAEEVLVNSNRKVLEQLAFTHLKLLVAQSNLKQTAKLQAKQDDLKRQAALLERELKSDKLSPALRESKAATLEIHRKRIKNLERRELTLDEIEGDLQRIEAQLDLAVENAVIEGRPQSLSTDIKLASIMLDSDTESSMYFGPADPRMEQLNKIGAELGLSPTASSESIGNVQENAAQ